MSVDIVIPVLNQLHYTKQCLHNLTENTDNTINIIVINNGSTDGTREYLSSLNFVTTIDNDINLGCAAAWNQGIKAGNSTWVAILNNDVLLPKGWLEGLIEYADESGVDIASPGMKGGTCDYDFARYAVDFMKKMSRAARTGEAHGVCFMVRRDIFREIGYFDENFKIGQYEDADFFIRAKSAGFRLAITGRSFIHHFGSVTQNTLKNDTTTRPYEAENRAYFRKKWKLGWVKRFFLRQQIKLKTFTWRLSEKFSYGYSLY